MICTFKCHCEVFFECVEQFARKREAFEGFSEQDFKVSVSLQLKIVDVKHRV